MERRKTKPETKPKCSVPLCEELSVGNSGLCEACRHWWWWVQNYLGAREVAAYVYRRRRLVSRLDHFGVGREVRKAA